MLLERRMTRNPITISPELRAVDALELMKKERVRRFPVLDLKKNLVGLLCERDLLKVPSLTEYLVKDLMTTELVTVDRQTPCEDAARIMLDQEISTLPVMDKGRLVGLITKSDLFNIILELFGARHFGVRVECIVENRPGALASITHSIALMGWDIISVGTFQGNDPSSALFIIKVEGCMPDELKEVLEGHCREILDIRES